VKFELALQPAFSVLSPCPDPSGCISSPYSSPRFSTTHPIKGTISAFSSPTSKAKLELWTDAFQELELEEGEELGFGGERD
jgi:hypothetical protein